MITEPFKPKLLDGYAREYKIKKKDIKNSKLFLKDDLLAGGIPSSAFSSGSGHNFLAVSLERDWWASQKKITCSNCNCAGAVSSISYISGETRRKYSSETYTINCGILPNVFPSDGSGFDNNNYKGRLELRRKN